MKIALCVITVMAACVSTAYADIQMKDYERFRKAEPGFTDYLVGVGRGAFWSSIISETNGGQRTICVPKDVRLTEEVILSTIDQEARKRESQGYWPEDTPIELIAVKALMKKFPCHK